MRILIIGGTGFIGSHVVKHLDHAGHDVVLFRRGQTEDNSPPKVKNILGERLFLAEFSGEFRRLAPNVVIDMIPATEQDAKVVISTFKGIAQRVVAISSMDVYRAYGRIHHTEPGSPDPIPLSEDAPLREKLYPYRGKYKDADDYEKIVVERVVMSDPALPGTVLRFPMVYGPRDNQHRFFDYLKRMDDKRPFILLDEGYAHWRGSRGYVENIASAIALATIDTRAAGHIYNAGEPTALSTVELIREIGQVAGWQGEIVTAPKDHLPHHLSKDADTSQHWVIDTTRIRNELGYKESVHQEEAIRLTIEWERANPPTEIDTKMFNYAAEDAIVTGEFKQRARANTAWSR